MISLKYRTKAPLFNNYLLVTESENYYIPRGFAPNERIGMTNCWTFFFHSFEV